MEWPENPTQEEAERFFARCTNGQTWELLERSERTQEEGEHMLSAAYASLFHWRRVGTPKNWQRGEWLVSRAHAALGLGAEAMRHARICLELTQAHPEDMEDFDLAFAQEAMARAFALTGEARQAAAHLRRAEEAGRTIMDAEDRAVFIACLLWGDWRGLAPASS